VAARDLRRNACVWGLIVYMRPRAPLVIAGAFWACDALAALGFSGPLTNVLVAAGFVACSPLIEPFVWSLAEPLSEPFVGASAEPVPAPALAVARSTPAQRMPMRIHRQEE
jgi:hypothetical protein